MASDGGGGGNECEENMVIFHKNRQMRTQPEGEKEKPQENRQKRQTKYKKKRTPA